MFSTSICLLLTTVHSVYRLYSTYCSERMIWSLWWLKFILTELNYWSLCPCVISHYQSYQSRSKFPTTAYCTVHYARQAKCPVLRLWAGGSPSALESLHRCHRKQNCSGGDWGSAGHTHTQGLIPELSPRQANKTPDARLTVLAAAPQEC